MFEISLSEILVVAVVALVVLGPEELPGAIRSVTKFLRSMKQLAAEVQQGIESLAQEDTVKDLRRTLEAERRYIIDESGKYREVFDLSDMGVSNVASSHVMPDADFPGERSEMSGKSSDVASSAKDKLDASLRWHDSSKDITHGNAGDNA